MFLTEKLSRFTMSSDNFERLGGLCLFLRYVLSLKILCPDRQDSFSIIAVRCLSAREFIMCLD